MLKIHAEKCTGRDLKPGDLFSVSGPEYWDHFALNQSIGEKAYIRTDTDAENSPDAGEEVYRLRIETSDTACEECGTILDRVTGYCPVSDDHTRN